MSDFSPSSRVVTNMLKQFLVGGGVSLVNITIHGLVMTTVVASRESRVQRKSLTLRCI
jgi:hypothetical protein